MVVMVTAGQCPGFVHEAEYIDLLEDTIWVFFCITVMTTMCY